MRRAASSRRLPGLVPLGLAPRGVCRAAPVTRSAGALLPHPCTPYPDGRRGGTALCCTSRRADVCRHAFPLGSTVPCGVRTFLTAFVEDKPHTRTERSPDPHAVEEPEGALEKDAVASVCSVRPYRSMFSIVSLYRSRSTMMRPVCSQAMMRLRWRISTWR